MKRLKKLITLLMVALMLGTAIPEAAAVLSNLETVEAATIKMSKTQATLNIGKNLGLKVTGTTKKSKWKSSNKAIASVTTAGKVTAHKKGTATITAQVGAKTYKCKITVKEQNVSCVPSKKATFTGVEVFTDTYPYIDYAKVTINSFSTRITTYSTYINYNKPITVGSEYYYPYKYLIKITGKTDKKFAGEYIYISFSTRKNGVLETTEIPEVSAKVKNDGTFSISQTKKFPNRIDSLYICYIDM